MFKLLAASIALSSVVLAAPAPGGRGEDNNHGFEHFAKFGKKDGKGVEAAGAIGVYNDIYWQGFSIADGKNKHAYYGYGYGYGNENGKGYMTVDYDGSKYDHFDLNSFYFGCGSGSGKAEGEEAGVDCAVNVKGYDKGGKEVGSQSFNYKGDGGQNKGQQYANLEDGFKGVYKVEFSTSSGYGQGVGTYIDSVGYKVYGKGEGGN